MRDGRDPSSHGFCSCVAVFMALLMLFYFSGPYWTLWRMGAALQAEDEDEFSTYVDYEAIRASLKRDILADIEKRSGLRGRTFSPGQMAMAENMVDPILNRFVSPTSIEILLAEAQKANLAAGASDSSWSGIWNLVDVERIGLIGFSVGTEERRPLIFERRGFGYRLVRIDLSGAAL